MPDLTLTDFLLARIAEDEAVARAAFDPAYGTDALGRWVVISIPYEGSWPRDPDADGIRGDASDEEWVLHATRHDPARVVAEADAKRHIVEQHRWAVDVDWSRCGLRERTTWKAARSTIAALASIHADHPDYRDEWRP